MSPRDRPFIRRLGLYAPLVVVLIVAVAWSLGWLWLKGQVEGQMDAAQARSTSQGGAFRWSSRRIYGFPFRLDIDLKGLTLGEPSGWALGAPRLQAEAFVFAPRHWVLVAPDGAIVTRRSGGPLIVKATALRASLSDLSAMPPRISVEGLGLAFATPRDAAPYFLDSAAELHIHTMAGPDDQGAVFLELDRARARLGGLSARVAGGRPLNIIADLIYSRASRLAGPDWPSAVRQWSDAGGEITVRRLQIRAGQAVLDAHAGRLTVGDDGRLRGALTASLGQAPRALRLMGEAGKLSPGAADTASAVIGAEGARPAVTATIQFQAGQTTLGPAAIGPAPRLY